jgi:hypothetical protein
VPQITVDFEIEPSEWKSSRFGDSLFEPEVPPRFRTCSDYRLASRDTVFHASRGSVACIHSMLTGPPAR